MVEFSSLQEFAAHSLASVIDLLPYVGRGLKPDRGSSLPWTFGVNLANLATNS